MHKCMAAYSTCIHTLSINLHFALKPDKQMSNWGDPLHGVLLFLHTLCFVLIWTCGRTQALVPTGHPGPTPHRLPLSHTHGTSCASVFLYMCVCMPACWGKLCLNATAAWQSVSVVPVTHTAGSQYCVGTVFSVSVIIATSCLCYPHTKSNRGFPGLRPLHHICQTVYLSVCMYVFLRLSPTSLFIRSLLGFDPLLVTNWGVRHCSYLRGLMVSCPLWCETAWNKKNKKWASRIVISRCSCAVRSSVTSALSQWWQVRVYVGEGDRTLQ